MKKPVILYRPFNDPFTPDTELRAMYDAGFEVKKSRASIRPNDLVVGRYSVLPYYNELAGDIALLEAYLINSYRQHLFVADVMEWAPLLEGLTPKTYDVLADLPEGQYVVKGQTNSRKDRWNTHMFAASKAEAVDVTLRLQEDSLISSQKIYYREYVPLNTYFIGLNGMPVTEEYRYFCCDTRILSKGFYWSSYATDFPGEPPVSPIKADLFVFKVLMKLRENPNCPRFVVIDIAKTQAGEWMVVELNDAQMSGLSENDPDILYGNLMNHLESCPEGEK